MFRLAKNKTEEMLNRVLEILEGSKKKYAIFVRDGRGIMYIDHSKDNDFLRGVRDQVSDVLKDETVETKVMHHYWNENHSHTPYRNHLGDMGDDFTLEKLIEKAGIEDGDEIEIVIRKTGRRPDGDRRIRFVEAHTYAMETEEEAKKRTSP